MNFPTAHGLKEFYVPLLPKGLFQPVTFCHDLGFSRDQLFTFCKQLKLGGGHLTHAGDFRCEIRAFPGKFFDVTQETYINSGLFTIYQIVK